MKSKLNRGLQLGVTVAGMAVLQSSCSTGNSEAWAKIQSEGLIPYLAEGQTQSIPLLDDVPSEAGGSPRPQRNPSQQNSHQQSYAFGLSGVITAQEVSGKPGFVYSPHTSELLEIDVREFAPGARVRCPYTKKSFVVPRKPDVSPGTLPSQPDLQLASDRTPATRPTAPELVAAPEPGPDLAGSTPIVTPKPDEPKEIAGDSLPLDPEPIAGIPKSNGLPSGQELLGQPKSEGPEVPVGRRVEGKPNYVYSPFAASNQVVDVEGHAPGTKVKCPYTGKIFAVPAE